MPKLENWSVVSYPTNPFQAPELWPGVLPVRFMETLVLKMV